MCATFGSRNGLAFSSASERGRLSDESFVVSTKPDCLVSGSKLFLPSVVSATGIGSGAAAILFWQRDKGFGLIEAKRTDKSAKREFQEHIRIPKA